jgi:hypothetical protein
MIGNFLAVDNDTLQSIISDPEILSSIIYPEDEFESNGDYLNIDKSWHAIHFLLNDSNWSGTPPLFNVILGGKEIGEDVGYGPVRYLTCEEVKELSVSLENIGDDIISKYNADKLNENEIYPQLWEEDEQVKEFLKSCFIKVKNFYNKAASDHKAVLLFLN